MAGKSRDPYLPLDANHSLKNKVSFPPAFVWFQDANGSVPALITDSGTTRKGRSKRPGEAANPQAGHVHLVAFSTEGVRVELNVLYDEHAQAQRSWRFMLWPEDEAPEWPEDGAPPEF